MARWLILLFATLIGCGESIGGRLHSNIDDSGTILGIAGAGRGAVHRLDGDVLDQWKTRVTADEDQLLVVTGRRAGEDQCKVIVYADDGRRLVDYRPPMETPWPADPLSAPTRGERWRERVCPYPQAVGTFQRDGRRFVYVATHGLFAPSVLVVLEATDRTTLEERFVFWNFGHFHHVAVDGPHLVAVGFNNALQEHGKYRAAIATFRLSEIAFHQRRWEASSPLDAGDPTLRRPITHYWSPSNDRGWEYGPSTAEIEGAELRLRCASGIEYRFDLTDGSSRIGADDQYAIDYPGRRRKDPALPPLEEHLDQLLRATLLWSTGPS